MTDELSKQEKEILDGTIWDQFCDTLKMAGNVVMGPNAPSDALNLGKTLRQRVRAAT